MICFFVAPIVIGILAAILLPQILVNSEIDSCLDAGGSFNYESCKCDFSANQPYKEKHQCK